ncbi:NAC domain-containing protein 35-like [Raphanus sativus]|uniref:NAC domain-containing protein 35-like n=1 Tax=Raphanus sativus TaxID=3726 RepID=A0A6J0M1L7_RAPSA|nr:NAC domain-containing protein 35-like [Raphanus sativus]
MSNNYEDGGVYFDPDENMFNNDEDGGIYFNPEDQELIKLHLLPKLETYRKPKSKDEEREDFIEMKNVYDKEPWLLDHTNHPLFRKNEWFYFVTRSQVSVKNIGRGRNSKRRVNGDNDGGSWKPNAKKYIEDEETGETIGKKQTLKFTKSDKKKQKRGDGTSVVVPGSNSSWIMHEYSLPDENTFQELVLCKIRKISNSKDEDDHHESIPASSSEPQRTNTDHEIAPAPSSLEHQQPLLCHRGEANMVHQKEDTTAVIQMIPRRSSHRDEHVEAMEVAHNVEEDGSIGDLSDKLASTGLDDQQQTPIYAAPPARPGDRSLPIDVDKSDDDDEVMNQELDTHLF